MATAYNLINIISPAQLTTSDDDYYTVGANKKCEIRKLTFTNNNSAAAVKVTLALVPSGGSVSDTTTIKKEKSLSPAGQSGDTWQCPEALGHLLNAGDSIHALSDTATSVSIRGTGMEIIG